MAGTFVLVTGVGHCGTKWLAHVLDRPQDGMVGFHEQKTVLIPGTWLTMLQHEHEHGIDDSCASYFEFMRAQLEQHQVVVDSNSWTFAMIPAVHRRLSIHLVICLVRNGIQNIHSQFQHEIIPRNDWLYTHYLERYWRLVGRPGGDWSAYTDWGARCFAWSLNLSMPDWIGERIGRNRVGVYRLEDLVGTPEALPKLITRVRPSLSLGEDAVAILQHEDINRKIAGDRSPEALWASWTGEQRAVFTRICGPTMERYRYPIPPQP